MKADERQPDSAALEQWIRAVCGEGEPVGPLRDRIAADPPAAAVFKESREFVSELRTALKPRPLPESLVRTIDRRICRGGRGSPRLLRLALPLATVAAACAAFALVARYECDTRPRLAENASIALSAEDTAEIVAANIELSWEGQLQTTVDEIALQVNDLKQATEQLSQMNRNLPWSAEDDWDAATTESQSRAGSSRQA